MTQITDSLNGKCYENARNDRNPLEGEMCCVFVTFAFWGIEINLHLIMVH